MPDRRYYTNMGISEPYRIYNAEGLGQAIKHFREEAGLTQAELAARLGIPQPRLSELEAGKVTEQTERLVAVFKALGVRIVVGKADW
jgi:HTH-type transcriptional regulator/antitoxin HipB